MCSEEKRLPFKNDRHQPENRPLPITYAKCPDRIDPYLEKVLAETLACDSNSVKD